MADSVAVLKFASTSQASLDDVIFVKHLCNAYFEVGERRQFRDGIGKALKVSLDDQEMDVGNHALLDIYESLFQFAGCRAFSYAQVQKLLVLFRDTHADVTWASTSADLESAAMTLSKRLARLTTPQDIPVVETRSIQELVVEERPDPAAVAAAEAATAKKGDAKKKAAALATIPKIQVRSLVTKEVREEKTVTIDPFFGVGDVAAILDFLQETLFQHWHLFRFVATQQQDVDVKRIACHVMELPRLAPLTSAMALDEHQKKCAREAFWQDTVSRAFEAEFSAYVDILESLRETYVKETAVATAADGNRIREDKELAMTPEEFTRVSAVLNKRTAKSELEATLGAAEKRIERVEQAMTEKQTVKADTSKPGRR